MFGPCLSVYLREPLTAEQFDALDAWLVRVSARIQGKQGDRELWMDGAPVGCPGGDHQCMLLVFLRGPGPDEYGLPLFWEQGPNEIAQMGEHLGYLPEQEVCICAMCSSPIDHCLTGGIALHVARTYNGVVNLDSALEPPRTQQYGYWLGRTTPWPTLDEIRAFVRELPGTAWEMWTHDVEGARPSFLYHIVDAIFMESWLRHPNYHLIK